MAETYTAEEMEQLRLEARESGVSLGVVLANRDSYTTPPLQRYVEFVPTWKLRGEKEPSNPYYKSQKNRQSKNK
jgi:hypothetical protein